MSINTVGIEHLCNVVRRNIEEEFKDLKFFILLHKDKEREAAIEKHKKYLVDQPSGRKILELLKRKKSKDVSEFLGICIDQPSGPFKAFGTRTNTAVICLNYERYIAEENAIHAIYHMFWHALLLFQEMKTNKIPLIKGQSAVTPKNSRLTLTQKNLMADVFGAIMMEFKGTEGFIQKLAKERSLEALTNVKHHNPEYFPFPITHEACSLIYNDMKEQLGFSKRPIGLAMEMAEEVAYTYDNNSIMKWWAFAGPAQEMAWIKATPEDILGYALYSCEDPYLRTIAHQIFENIGMQPAIHTNIKTYNPFADNHSNARYHKTRYEEIFKDTISKVTLEGDEQIFTSVAKHVNNDLVNGNFSGWCSYALLKAQHAYTNMDDNQGPEHVRNVFYQSMEETPWEALHDLSRLIIKIRRQNGTVDIPSFLKMLKKAGKFKAFAEGLEISKNTTENMFNASAEGTQKIEKNTSYFIQMRSQNKTAKTALGKHIVTHPKDAETEKETTQHKGQSE